MCVCMWVCASFVCTHVCVCVVHVSYSIHNPVVKGQSIYKYKYAVGVHVRVQSGVLYNPVMPTLLPPPDPPATACPVAAAAEADGQAAALLPDLLPGGEGPARVPQEQSQGRAAAGAPGRGESPLVPGPQWSS